MKTSRAGTHEEMFFKLDEARNNILHEIFKIETVIKLGDAESMRDSNNNIEDSVDWTYVFQILADIKNKAMEKVGLLEMLIYDFKEMEKKET